MTNNVLLILSRRRQQFWQAEMHYLRSLTRPIRPPRPTVPVTVDPSNALLSGRPVIVETLRKRNLVDDVMEQVRKNKLDESSLKNKKIYDPKQILHNKSTTTSKSQRVDFKDISANRNVPPMPPPKTVKKVQSSKRRMEREANPTMLVMKFPAEAALPSSAEVRAKFARFGPMDHSSTRVFWKSCTCRLVYLHKDGAEVAIEFSHDTSNLFGNSNVKCHLRELQVEAATQSKSIKQDVSVLAPKIVALPPLLLGQQLKSCMKKPLVEEGGNNVGEEGRGWSSFCLTRIRTPSLPKSQRAAILLYIHWVLILVRFCQNIILSPTILVHHYHHHHLLTCKSSQLTTYQLQSKDLNRLIAYLLHLTTSHNICLIF
ncbi:hypothetical protein ABFS83_02G097700 [Erythranthe nasuta]